MMSIRKIKNQNFKQKLFKLARMSVIVYGEQNVGKTILISALFGMIFKKENKNPDEILSTNDNEI